MFEQNPTLTLTQNISTLFSLSCFHFLPFKGTTVLSVASKFYEDQAIHSEEINFFVDGTRKWSCPWLTFCQLKWTGNWSEISFLHIFDFHSLISYPNQMKSRAIKRCNIQEEIRNKKTCHCTPPSGATLRSIATRWWASVAPNGLSFLFF